MAITDKTRKALWAKSGNRCAICKIELVQSTEANSGNIIIGEECHMVSPTTKGPRGKIDLIGSFDAYENLILLCANDHKKVDELIDLYSVKNLKSIKNLHEQWVKNTLEKDASAFTNDKLHIKSLPKITSGKQLLDLVNSAHLYNFEHEEIKREEEAEKLGIFFEELQDYGDILSDMGFAEVTKLGYRWNSVIDDLKKMGFILFGLRRIESLITAGSKLPSDYDIATVIAVRDDSPSIVGEFLIAKFPHKFNVGF
jgi:hypothetical protein